MGESEYDPVEEWAADLADDGGIEQDDPIIEDWRRMWEEVFAVTEGGDRG